MSLSALARANNIAPHTKLNVGDRITIPGGARQVAAVRPAPAMTAPAPSMAAAPPQLAQPRTVPAEKVATLPAQTVAHGHA